MSHKMKKDHLFAWLLQSETDYLLIFNISLVPVPQNRNPNQVYETDRDS